MGPAILEPCPVQRAAKSVVPAFQVVDQPRPRIPVVVVIRLEDVAEGIHCDLVRIPEVLTDDLDVRPVRIHAQRGAFEIARPLSRVGACALRLQVTAGFVGQLETGVALVEVVLAVGAEHDGVQAVIVIDSAEPGQQHFLLHDLVVFVFRVDDQVGRLGDVHLVAENGDAERHANLRALVEDLDLVGLAVLIRVLEDDDAVALRPGVREVALRPPVVHAFQHPHPSALVDGEVRGVQDHGLGGPELQLEARRNLECCNTLPRILLTLEDGSHQRHSAQERHEPGRMAGSHRSKQRGSSHHALRHHPKAPHRISIGPVFRT